MGAYIRTTFIDELHHAWRRLGRMYRVQNRVATGVSEYLSAIWKLRTRPPTLSSRPVADEIVELFGTALRQEAKVALYRAEGRAARPSPRARGRGSRPFGLRSLRQGKGRSVGLRRQVNALTWSVPPNLDLLARCGIDSCNIPLSGVDEHAQISQWNIKRTRTCFDDP